MKNKKSVLEWKSWESLSSEGFQGSAKGKQVLEK